LKVVTHDKIIYKFSGENEPVFTVNPGEEVVFETLDARGGRAVPGQVYTPPPRPPVERLNPATGPVAIEGAEPGDTLVAEIKEIKLGSAGYVFVSPNVGVLKDYVTIGTYAKPFRLEGNTIVFREDIRIPTRPMVGTIGVAPLGEGVVAFAPGIHGGNMDNNDVEVGSKAYFPVFVKGAHFALGDVHASMGDGEISGGGLDISSDVRVKFEVLKGKTIRRPLIESRDHMVTTFNAKDLNAAVRGVLEESVHLLTQHLGITNEEAIMFLSTAGDVRISQAADAGVDVTTRCRMPKLFPLP